MTIDELRALIIERHARLTELANIEDRDLNEDESTEWATLNTDYDDARSQLAEMEARQARRAELASHVTERTPGTPHPLGVPGGRGDTTEQLDVRAIRSMRAGELRDRSLALLAERSKDVGLDDAALRSVERHLRRSDGYVAGRLLLTETDAYRSAFVKGVTRANPVFTAEEAEAIQAFEDFERAMSIGTDSGGGYGIPVLIDPSIIYTGAMSDNDFLRLCTVKDITTDVWKGVTSAGVSWSFDAEAAAVGDDAPTLAQPSVTTHMARGFIPHSIEVGMDYPDFADEMSALLVQGYNELLVEKFTTGSGSGEPMGIVTALDANTNVEVVVTTDGALGYVDSYAVWKALPQRWRRQASWMMSIGVNNAFKLTGDDKLASQTRNMAEGAIDVLHGKPVYENSYMADFSGVTTAVNLAVVGAFSQYVVARRAGMNVELVPHLFDVTNNRPTGQRGLFAWARIGGAPVVDDAFRLLQNA